MANFPGIFCKHLDQATQSYRQGGFTYNNTYHGYFVASDFVFSCRQQYNVGTMWLKLLKMLKLTR